MTTASIVIAIGLCILFVAWQQRHRLGIGTTVPNFRPRQPHLERKLIKLLNGDRRTAARLIQQSRLKDPDRAADWHWEKVIYDLERDRWR
jgi:hypothetical protein